MRTSWSLELLAKAMMILLGIIAPGTIANGEVAFLNEWGQEGTGNGQFNTPWDIAIGPGGHVYVVEYLGHRIQKFDRAGAYVAKWGSQGPEAGQFKTPGGIAVDTSGRVYVGDQDNDRIQIFDGQGNHIDSFESSSPRGVAVASTGEVYAVSHGEDRVNKHSSTGVLLSHWGPSGTDWSFNRPEDIALDSTGHAYVGGNLSDMVYKFDMDGTLVTSWGTRGTGNGEFHWPEGVAIGPYGHVYVADSYNNRIQKFSAHGDFISKWGSRGAGSGEFETPMSVAVNEWGEVYVADQNNHRIQRFYDSGPHAQPISNCAFHEDLSDWVDSEFGTGSVSPTALGDPYGNVAVLRRQVPWGGVANWDAKLSQTVSFDAYVKTLEFDFFATASVHPGLCSDTALTVTFVEAGGDVYELYDVLEASDGWGSLGPYHDIGNPPWFQFYSDWQHMSLDIGHLAGKDGTLIFDLLKIHDTSPVVDLAVGMDSVYVSFIPEPTSLSLLALVSVVGLRRRKKQGYFVIQRTVRREAPESMRA